VLVCIDNLILEIGKALDPPRPPPRQPPRDDDLPF
jgi:hypothetical protein